MLSVSKWWGWVPLPPTPTVDRIPALGAKVGCPSLQEMMVLGQIS